MLRPNPPIVCLLIVTVRSCRGLSEKRQAKLIQSDAGAAETPGQMWGVTEVKTQKLNPTAVKTALIRRFAIYCCKVSQLNSMVGATLSDWLRYLERFWSWKSSVHLTLPKIKYCSRSHWSGWLCWWLIYLDKCIKFCYSCQILELNFNYLPGRKPELSAGFWQTCTKRFSKDFREGAWCFLLSPRHSSGGQQNWQQMNNTVIPEPAGLWKQMRAYRIMNTWDNIFGRLSR